MTARLRSLPLLVTLALLAFLLGSAGTAVAGPGLTERAVAKIAGKVLKKKAPKLTVSNANKLAGKPASAYQDNATIYSVDLQGAYPSQEITVPLEPGNYQIAYSVYLAGGSATSLCMIERSRGGSLLTTADQGTSGFGPSVSAIGFVDVRAGDTVVLRCSSGSAWNTSSGEPIHIIATPLDSARIVPITIS